MPSLMSSRSQLPRCVALSLQAAAALSREALATQLMASDAQAIFDLEATNQELKGDLRDLYITSAKEVEVASARKAIVIHVSGTAVCSGP